ncbi:4759_t:CDS:2, partial [Scutellospora calospora]
MTSTINVNENIEVENTCSNSDKNSISEKKKPVLLNLLNYESEITKIINNVKCSKKTKKGIREITGEYRFDKNIGESTTWEINKNNQLSVYKTDQEGNNVPINFDWFVKEDDCLGTYLLPNDYLIVITKNYLMILAETVQNKIQIIYYIKTKNIIEQQRCITKKIPTNLWDIWYFKSVLDIIDQESDINTARYLREMLTLYLDDIDTFAHWSPKRLSLFSAITSSISELQELYPYYVTKFFVCTSIISLVDVEIKYTPYSHLHGFTDEKHISKSKAKFKLKEFICYIYKCFSIDSFLDAFIGLVIGLIIGLIIAILAW